MKKTGFTLSETLIVLTIIGVIAAITIPVLHANYVEKDKTSEQIDSDCSSSGKGISCIQKYLNN